MRKTTQGSGKAAAIRPHRILQDRRARRTLFLERVVQITVYVVLAAILIGEVALAFFY